MTAIALPPVQEREPSRWPARWRKLRAVAGAVTGVTLDAVKQHTRPVASQLRENLYSVMGFGCIDACAFKHSVFTGLLVTGLMFLVFEWKVSDE